MSKKHAGPDKDKPEFEIVSDDASSLEETQISEAPSAEASEFAALKEQIAKLNNDALYQRAEFDNYRKQAIKERSDLVKFSGEKIVHDLLDTLDIFDTALATEVTAENYKNFLTGIQMTAQQLRNTLSKHGITAMDAEGKPFDPNVHEAIGAEPTDKVEPGYISRVAKKPYKYHDKVIRPGQVIVAAKPKE